MVVNYQIESTPLSSIIANLNSFATLPTTSKGAGEIIHYSGDNTIRWNSQTTNPTTNPIWSDLSAGGWDGNATSNLDMNNYSIKEVNIIYANTLSSYNAGKVSIVHSLVPSIDSWIDLGDATHTFDEIYVDTVKTTKVVTGDHGAAATDEVVNVCYGTSATPPTASTTTEGALYIQYTA